MDSILYFCKAPNYDVDDICVIIKQNLTVGLFGTTVT